MHKVKCTVHYLVGPKGGQAVQHSMNDTGIICPPQFVQQNRNQGRDLQTFHIGGFRIDPSLVVTKALKYIFIAISLFMCFSNLRDFNKRTKYPITVIFFSSYPITVIFFKCQVCNVNKSRFLTHQCMGLTLMGISTYFQILLVDIKSDVTG